jgi:hypothetical protein
VRLLDIISLWVIEFDTCVSFDGNRIVMNFDEICYCCGKRMATWVYWKPGVILKPGMSNEDASKYLVGFIKHCVGERRKYACKYSQKECFELRPKDGNCGGKDFFSAPDTGGHTNLLRLRICKGL